MADSDPGGGSSVSVLLRNLVFLTSATDSVTAHESQSGPVTRTAPSHVSRREASHRNSTVNISYITSDCVELLRLTAMAASVATMMMKKKSASSTQHPVSSCSTCAQPPLIPCNVNRGGTAISPPHPHPPKNKSVCILLNHEAMMSAGS